MAFSNQEVSNYYDQTAVHYRYFWNLNKSMALHYGITQVEQVFSLRWIFMLSRVHEVA